MFKVGDKVKLISMPCWGISIGQICTVDKVDDRGYFSVEEVETKYRYKCGFVSKNWRLVESAVHMPLYSTEEAVKWLEKEGFFVAPDASKAAELLNLEGYTVTPPPEPLKGKVVLYYINSGKKKCIYSKAKDAWDSTSTGYKNSRTIIAIVDWTEGDGL